MKARAGARILFSVAVLAPLLWGCRDTLIEIMHHGAADSVPVSIVLGREGNGSSRTIAPSHVPVSDLADPALYKLVLTGSSDMGDRVTVDGFALKDGRGFLALTPGAWTLRLTATPAGGAGTAAAPILGGSTLLVVQDRPTTSSITLTPLAGTGTVDVRFSIPQSVVARLDPSTSTNKTVTVALYDDSGLEVAGTRQDIALTYNAAQTAPYAVTYMAGGLPVPSGRYTLRLEASYTVNNASTNNQDRVHTLGWSDILYVEGGRLSTASVAIPEARAAMGVPGNPYRQDKVTVNGSRGTPNFTAATPFNPFGETLWMYGSNWDSTGGNTDSNGNEVLVVDWDSVYDADYYELELLVHPFTGYNSSNPTSRGKFNKVVTTDADWETLKSTTFNYSGQMRTPSYMRYSGNQSDPDYYKTKTWVIKCNDNSDFLSCADKPLARTLFPNKGAAAGKVNANYRLLQTQDAFDTYTDWSYQSTSRGKVGLEGDCGVIGVLMPAYSPRMSVVYRVRAVNRYGYSDWVYWKGGIW